MQDDTGDRVPEKFSINQHRNDFIMLWSLRVLLKLNFKARFFDLHRVLSNFDVLQSIGLLDYYDNDLYQQSSDYQPVVDKMTKHLQILEQDAPFEDDVTLSGIRFLESSLLLTKTDVDLLHFASAANQNNGLGMLLDMMGELSHQQVKQVLSVLLGLPTKEIDRSFSTQGALLTSGLFNEYQLRSRQPSLRLSLMLPDNISSALSRSHASQASLLESFFRASPEPRLLEDDYQHIAQDFQLIKRYLKAALENNTEGVNILIYGAPGTGKTEMVRALCAEAGVQLHEITMESNGGQPVHGPERFVTLRLSQRLLGESTSDVLMFDEIEDVFPMSQHYFHEHNANVDVKKSWVNNILEVNKVPTFWVSNQITQIDPSYLRRFDIALQLRPLNSDMRLRVIKKYLCDLSVSDTWLIRMSEQEHLVPAIIERAVKVAKHLNINDAGEAEALLEKIIGNTLEAMGLPRSTRKKAPQNTQYDLQYLNPDADLVQLCERFNENSQARICLYGPSGTGKTAFAHYLAGVLGKGILVKRASDILSKWVGEAEKNIAGMFEEAMQNNQILLLDEADSFLQERQSAGQVWEVTQVNEILVQMEVFSGIFIASTNLKDSLDAASLRRFDFKVKFDYMRLEQSWNLFQQIMKENDGVEQITSAHKTALGKLDKLTAGDFSTVIRQVTCLSQALTPDLLLEGLQKEVKAKPNYSQSIGFV